MRLPQHLLESPFFSFTSLAEFVKALGEEAPPIEIEEVKRLAALGLPPITSRYALATMIGVNPGLIWSFESRPQRHYRSFSIPKGRTVRKIDAPRVALKIVQKWLSVQLQRVFQPMDHIYGFVCGRSHIEAATAHTSARWVFSVDIKDFFQSTPKELVAQSLQDLGFSEPAATLIASLSCLRGVLAQGAPSSPVLSNISFRKIDEQLVQVALKHGVRVSRYADDIVFSGLKEFPEVLRQETADLFANGHWRLADQKTKLFVHPQRLKVHGLLVHSEKVRLTKGYRNKLRAYRHLLTQGHIRDDDLAKVKGHLNYQMQVDKQRQ
jgi:hypothetical protein